MEDFATLLVALAALVIPLLFAWVVVGLMSNRESPNHVRKPRR